ncbi:ribosomal RNA small subunit methyltransferase mra1 [Rhizoctonia solani]|uniref:Ribosomal RNA small subunit methyltransferase mra1 n=1 Tax=Rhizoctonia solani TaxID=456999 RepID=A0A8H8NNZ5_9AGAM|nr:ribosomal RNA small subunit methyltransferase mra1 [Rhizoctonia solani]QRW15846.1 ribosomal RNA small subunit methyltransferase mra1 [Rhizoctonia solani]
MSIKARTRRHSQTGPNPREFTVNHLSRKRSQSMEQLTRNPRVVKVPRAEQAVESDSESDVEDSSGPSEEPREKENEEDAMDTSPDRPTRPLPNSKRRVIPTNPTMVPVQATVPRTPAQKSNSRRLIVVLEQACLEAYKVSSNSGNGRDAKYALLNCDDHQGILAKTGRDIADARPDITHQCLLTLLDSPLNKAGRLQVSTFTPTEHSRRNGSEKLLKVIKNPVTDHFPTNTYKITLSGDSQTVKLSNYLPTLPETHSIAVFVGAMARGKDDFADAIVDEKISISDYALSASVACGKFCCALEDLWDIDFPQILPPVLDSVFTKMPPAAPVDPLAGRVGHLTPEQEQTLAQFKAELQTEGHFVPERHDDPTLLRFLRARKFDLVKSKEMIIACEEWRKKFGVDDIVKNFHFKEKEQVNKFYPQYYHKMDKDGRPVYIERLGSVNVTELAKVTTEERQLQNLVLEYERFLHERLPACSAAAGAPVETSCTILDLKGVGIGSFFSVKDYVMKASAIGQNYYPETMGKFYIINTPFMFSTVWNVIKPWLDPVTVAKISIPSSSATEKELLAQIPKENLPADLGGSCNCPGGCSLSDQGPWNDPKYKDMAKNKVKAPTATTTAPEATPEATPAA